MESFSRIREPRKCD